MGKLMFAQANLYRKAAFHILMSEPGEGPLLEAGLKSYGGGAPLFRPSTGRLQRGWFQAQQRIYSEF